MSMTLVKPADRPRGAAPPVLPPPRNGFVDARRRAVDRLVGVVQYHLLWAMYFSFPHPWIGMALWLALASNPRLAAFGVLGLGVALAGQRALGIEPEAGHAGGLQGERVAVGDRRRLADGSDTLSVARPGRDRDRCFGQCLCSGRRDHAIPESDRVAVTALGILPHGGNTVRPLSCRHHDGRAAPVVVANTADRCVGVARGFLPIDRIVAVSPTIEVGIVIVGAILLWSRAAFAAGVVGWLAGASVALGVQYLGVTYYWLPASHNFFVAGMTLGALFILPGCASLVLAALAGAAASLIDVALQSQFPALAYLPTASALTIWIVLGRWRWPPTGAASGAITFGGSRPRKHGGALLPGHNGSAATSRCSWCP